MDSRAASPAKLGPSPSGRPLAAAPAARLAVLALRQGGLFTRAQAMHCGFSADQIGRRVRSGEWRPALGPVLAGHGLRITPVLRDYAALLAVGGSVLAGPSAARRLGVPVDDPLSYLAVPPDRRVRLPEVRLFRGLVPASEVVVVGGLPVTARARTVFDCLRVLPDDRAVDLLRLARHAGWISVDELADYLHQFTGRRGAKRLAQLSRSVAGESERAPSPRAVLLFETDRAAVELVPKAAPQAPGWRNPVRPAAAVAEEPRRAHFAPADLVERPGLVLTTLRALLDRGEPAPPRPR